MNKISAITLFCDSVRSESEGSHSIIGILPDKIQVDKIPGSMPRLAMYTRIIVDPKVEPTAIEMFLISPNGEERKLGEIPESAIKEHLANARTDKTFGLGLIFKASTTSLPVSQEGKFVSVLKSKLGELVCGSLKIELLKKDS